MNLCVTLLKVVLVVVFIEAVLGDVEGGDLGSKTEGGASTVTVDTICLPENGGPNKLATFYKLMTLVEPCVDELELRRMRNTTEEDRRGLIASICQKETRFKECLTENASRLEVCPDTNLLKVFNIMRDFFEHTFQSGCTQNGERFVKFFSGISKANGRVLEKCVVRYHSVMKSLEDKKVDLSVEIFIAHKEMTPFKECMRNFGFDLPMQETLDYFIEDTITTIKCIHPKDGTLVTCTSIDPVEMSFTNVCDVNTKHGQLSIYEVLEEDAVTWFDDFITQDQHEADEEDITTDIEKLREDFKEICSAEYLLRSHLEGVTVVADMCSSETERQEFSLLADNIKNTFYHACVEEDNRLADILFEVYRLKRTSPDHPNVVLKCIQLATATRNQSDDHKSSSKNMRFYHELETFKGCLVNEVHGDQTSVKAATSLISDILSLVNCVKPEDGTTVLCESLMHNHHH